MNVEAINFKATATKTSEKGRITKRSRAFLVCIDATEMANSFTNLMPKNMTERITASVTSKSGEVETIIPNTNLGNLVAFAQYKEGSSCVWFDAVYRGRFIVNLTLGDGIELNADQDLEISISGCRPDYTYRIIPLGAPVAGDSMLKYSNRTINQGTTNQDVPVGNVSAVILPDLPALESIQVQYTNGSTDVLTRESLAAVNQNENDASMVADGQIVDAYTYGLLYLNTFGVHKVTMYTTGDVYHFTTVQLIARG